MDDPRRRRRAAWLVLAGAVLWGTTGTAQALGPDSASPMAVGATRLVVGGLLLAIWAVVTTGAANRSADTPMVGHRRVAHALSEGAMMIAAATGAVAVAAYQLSFFAAVDTAGVALGTAVAIGSAPVFTGLVEWVINRRAPALRWWLATAVATAGVVVLAGPSRLILRGVVLALLAGASYAAYALASKRLLDGGLRGPIAMALVFGGGGALLAPLLFTVDLGWVTSSRGIAMVAWLGLATILLAYLLFAAGLAGLPASTVATLSLAEPLTAAALGISVLGERPTAVALAGAALILLGLIILVVPRAGRGPRRLVARSGSKRRMGQ